MTVLPIVERELRVAARRSGTYWMRWAAAVAALVAGAWIYGITHQGAPKETGMILFAVLAGLASLYALLSGLRTTADCLSEEKREGTLGLLFLTDLKGYDVVLGKLAATSLNSFYGLLAMFPVMGICLLLGGVSFGEFGRVVIVSIDNLFFSLTAGLFCSSICRADRKAVGLTFLIVSVLAALPLLGLAQMAARSNLRMHPAYCVLSPSYACFAAFETNYRNASSGHLFWGSVASILALSLAFLALAAWITPRSWQERARSGSARGLAGFLQQFQYGAGEVRLEHRQRLLEKNPVLWLCSREPYKHAMVLGALGALALIWIWGMASVRHYWLEISCVPTALILHSLLKIWLAGEAARRFSEDRASGALELILGTPLSVKQILEGQRLALLRQFAWPVLVIVLVDGLLMVAGIREFVGRDRAWVGMWLAGTTMLVWDLYALSWVGPWAGLNARQMSRATTEALVRICLLPWLAFLALISILGILEAFNYGAMRHLTAGFFIFTWFLLGAINNLFFANWARIRLERRFRSIATERFGARNMGAWGRILGEWWVRRR